MLKQQSGCCLCRLAFEATSQPRMMPHCAHSSCTNCLKHLLATRPSNITCLLCGTKQPLNDYDIEYFPKNMTLTKLLRCKSSATPFVKNQSSLQTADDNPPPERTYCELHKKQLEIICLLDRVRVCPHCALFGKHRDHPLKTVKETYEVMNQRAQQFHSYRSRKALLDQHLASTEFRDSIVLKIAEHKNRLIAEVRRKFNQLYEDIRLAEKRAFEDVAKRFKIIAAQVAELTKQEHQTLRQYKYWETQCNEAIQKADRCTRIEEKAVLYFNGAMDICKEGQGLIKKMEEKVGHNLSAIDTLISRIKLVQNQSVPNLLFNYVNVVIEDEEQLESLSHISLQTISPKHAFKQKPAKPQFSSDYFIKEKESTSGLSLTPPKRMSTSIDRSKNNNLPLRRSINSRKSSQTEIQTPAIQLIVADFCQKEHLDTLDLTNQSLLDLQITEILTFVKNLKKIRGLKLMRNRLTTEGLCRILDLVPAITNLNLSFNQLNDDAVTQLLANRQKVPQLRIVNLSNNRINERRAKVTIEQLKKQGLIVTI